MTKPRAKRRESPVKRINPSGETVWKARYTDPEGHRRSAGTFKRKRDAQDAIDNAYEREDERLKQAPRGPRTVGDYADTWTTLRPRAQRTNVTNDSRISRVLDIRVDGVALRDWPFADLRRRHALDLVDHMLREQGRARKGVINILGTLSAMAEDAITDEIAGANPFRGVKIRMGDPRVLKESRPVRVFSWEQMHAFAQAAGAPARSSGGSSRSAEPRRSGGAAYDAIAIALARTFTDTGMRLQDVLPLRRSDLDRREMIFRVRRSAHEGEVQDGTKRDRLRNVEDPQGRIAPCPPSLLALIDAMPARIDTDLLFPTPSGKLWRERNFYRDLWYPTQRAAGIDPRPHEMRHSYLTLLGAAGVNLADLSEMAGHDLDTLISRYTHPLNRSLDQVRTIIG